MSLASSVPPSIETFADLVEALGDIPLHRIRAWPAPGTATERDVLEVHAQEKRLCELVDGVLVDKSMGFDESRLALEISYELIAFLRTHDLGTVAGEAGMMRLEFGLVRIPDVSFIRWDRLPDEYGAIVPVAPDLAVEVLSETNTPREMDRKLREYFAAGTRLVWYFEPKTRTVTVYTAADQFTRLEESATLDGADLLPGLVIPLEELFERAARRRGQGR
jgi:Uma2 family endonuclease